MTDNDRFNAWACAGKGTIIHTFFLKKQEKLRYLLYRQTRGQNQRIKIKAMG